MPVDHGSHPFQLIVSINIINIISIYVYMCERNIGNEILYEYDKRKGKVCQLILIVDSASALFDMLTVALLLLPLFVCNH